MTFIVAIDGPAGTGKSSAARSLAKLLDFIYVDTGAIYRALAYLVDRHGVSADNIDDVLALVPLIAVVVDESHHSASIVVNGVKIEKELRTENISRLSSIVSQHKKVREALLPIQRNLINAIPKGAIFEGRDIGTVVFPSAPIKIFITANTETRAQRRYQELKNSANTPSYAEVREAIEKRDNRDEKRENAPMQKAHDAHVIDTSSMTLDEVIDVALDLIRHAHYDEEKPLW